MSTPANNPVDRELVVEFDDRDAVAELELALNRSEWRRRRQEEWDRRRQQGNPKPLGFILVQAFSGLRIELHLIEHPPPHFHVSGNGETASYRISDCEQLNGGLTHHYSVIKAWHAKNKPKLIQKWNESRPTDCPVGPYREG